ncbi:MAG: RnfH family protein [Methylococcaceae bacterium]|jgi:putative ubiquitin-RnfH superfamily antitoxin RatB of RatAB toxin-antitoxin module
MRVEVIYATPEQQLILTLEMPEEATAGEAILASGITARYPEIKLADGQIGVFSRPCDLNHRLRPGDRVEIYRPLRVDPMMARRARALRK